ncbi:imidazole glycerol phosphate synthase subunit HisF [Paenibacillus thalictri]|uniref:Imidazole glycerol phosphate synthase subunit HisF n=1 Tax=Paenibacillus thalictri TaxID=2527873 RepID=A0A4V2J2Y6_9BACL|nr:imidazole glycerol phosphate synthase cyclase subunit [Paenibacillus thalictri]TBL67780.1 imidazole glycerol phosphate synthase subunit HisF [Paenibacillus thalictri]
MLKKRIIPLQLLLNSRLVKTLNFDSYRDVGDPVNSSKIYDSQDADELVFLNIDRSNRTIEPLLKLIDKVSEVCFMPLALGGGIKTVEDATSLILNGADKIIINSKCYDDKSIITKISEKFGSQAVVVSIDVKRNVFTNKFDLYSACGIKKEMVSLENHISAVVEAGAGEILINSIDKDGTMSGYDLDLLKTVSALSCIPIIGCGGSGNFVDLLNAFSETSVDALGCGSIFNFGDNNPLRAKAFLKNYNIPLKHIG